MAEARRDGREVIREGKDEEGVGVYRQQVGWNDELVLVEAVDYAGAAGAYTVYRKERGCASHGVAWMFAFPHHINLFWRRIIRTLK